MSEKKMPQFADYVEISATDTIVDPLIPTMKVLKYLFFGQIKTLCSKCHDYKRFKLIKSKSKGDCFTIKCGCGVDIIYPESEKRNGCRLWVRIPKEEYKRGKSCKKQRNKKPSNSG